MSRWKRTDRHPIESLRFNGTTTPVAAVAGPCKYYGVQATSNNAGTLTVNNNSAGGGTAIFSQATGTAPIMNEVPGGNYIKCPAGIELVIGGGVTYDITLFFERGDLT